MTDLFAISERLIDRGEGEAPPAPFDFTLTELFEGVARVNAFSLSIIFKTDEGLVVIDTGLKNGGPPIVEAIRRWSNDPFQTLIYTHGHLDHVGGSAAFLQDSKSNNHPPPMVIAHENVPKRFERYRLTNGYNMVINLRQTSQNPNRTFLGEGNDLFLDQSVVWPNITFSDHFSIKIGGLTFILHQAKGETDDHAWVWIPEKKTICPGDLFIWLFPNAGNPQKAQRYPVEWCQALRQMAGMGAEYFIPSHGWPIQGADRIRKACLETAEALDHLVGDTLEMMNRGCTLNEIIHTVKVDPKVLSRPFLRPLYDEPEFVVHNIWRLYGGWYDGNPANLKPARERDVAVEIAELAGGAESLASRALKTAEKGNLRLACHLIEMAALADPENKKVHGIRGEIYQQRRKEETSLMARAIFNQAEMDSKKISEEK
ncbi:MAG: MBL fold metallo-hydrolase [Deltaproteobacteria bacterium]|nr:MBL fold metallo-hydrolase [Deltaproteobacteria bacterium]